MRRGLWTADAELAGVMVLLFGLAFLADILAGSGSSPAVFIPLGPTLAVVPAMLWLSFFYRRDREEPEPKFLVGLTVLLTGLVALSVTEPLLALAPDSSGWASWVIPVLIVGVVREYTKYAAVSLVAVPAGEVNERADGVIYGTAAGLGYAVALNAAFVLESGVVNLVSGFAWMTMVTLVHAALGGLVGYLCARDSMGDLHAWIMGAGLLLVAAVDGLFFQARSAIASSLSSPDVPSQGSAWITVVLALVVAVSITTALVKMMRMEEART